MQFRRSAPQSTRQVGETRVAEDPFIVLRILGELLSFLVAVPPAIKVFHWTATLYRGRIRLAAPTL